MNHALARFELQLGKIEALTTKAKESPNPAQWLYLNDLRTPVFMLEALCRMYKNIHNKTSFGKLYDRLKSLEDGLGAVDHYAQLYKNAIEPQIYFEKQAQKSTKELNKLLEKAGWLDGSRIKKIRKKLNEAKWLSPAEDMAKIKGVFEKEIASITGFSQELIFDNIEEDVHELRRKIRWLAIYAIALNGMIKLEEKKPVKVGLKKYLTPEIIKSPFNKLPTNAAFKQKIVLEKNNYLALSWIIAEYGKLKDEGLSVEAATEGFKNLKLKESDPVYKKLSTLQKSQHKKIDLILNKAEVIKSKFLKDQVLTNLILK